MRHSAVVEVAIARVAARRSAAPDRPTPRYCLTHSYGPRVPQTSRVMSRRQDGACASATPVEPRSVELMKAEYMGWLSVASTVIRAFKSTCTSSSVPRPPGIILAATLRSIQSFLPH